MATFKSSNADGEDSIHLPQLHKRTGYTAPDSPGINKTTFNYGPLPEDTPTISTGPKSPVVPSVVNLKQSRSPRESNGHGTLMLPRYRVGLFDWLSITVVLLIDVGLLVLLALQTQNKLLVVGVSTLSPIAARQIASIFVVVVVGTEFNLLFGLMMDLYARLTTAQGTTTSVRVFRRITEPGLNFIGMGLSLFEGKWKIGAWLLSYGLLQLTHVLLVSGLVPEAVTIIGSEVNTTCADYRQIGGTLAEKVLPQAVINSLSAALLYNISMYNVSLSPASPVPVDLAYVGPTKGYGMNVSCQQELSLAIDTTALTYQFVNMPIALPLGVRSNTSGVSIVPISGTNYTFVDSTEASRFAILYSTGTYLTAATVTQVDLNTSSNVSGFGLITCSAVAQDCTVAYNSATTGATANTTSCTSHASIVELPLLIDWLQKLNSAPQSAGVYLDGSRLSLTVFGTVNGTLSSPIARIGSAPQIGQSLSTFYTLALSTGNTIAREASSVGEPGLLTTCIFHEPRRVIILALGNYLIGFGVGTSLLGVLIWGLMALTYVGRHAPLTNSLFSAGAGLGPLAKEKLEKVLHSNYESTEDNVDIMQVGYVSVKTSGGAVHLVLDETSTAPRVYDEPHTFAI
ncbi:hypothetical protein T439DRAFT_336068 [Meredithblackwellia eburnea MCA 4105]